MTLRLPALACAAGIGLASMATPASATLYFYVDITVNGVSDSFFCAATSACNTSHSASELTLANTTINGVEIRGEDDASSGTPANPGVDFLSSSVGRVINTNGYAASVDVVVGDTSFTGPVTIANLAGAGTFQQSVGSTFKMNWFADASNMQGGSGGSTPGHLIGSYAAPTVSSVVQGVSYTSPSLPVTFTAPFSLTERTVYTLAEDGGQLINRGQTAILTSVPETSTWVMLVLGFAGLGLVGRKKERRSTI